MVYEPTVFLLFDKNVYCDMQSSLLEPHRIQNTYMVFQILNEEMLSQFYGASSWILLLWDVIIIRSNGRE